MLFSTLNTNKTNINQAFSKSISYDVTKNNQASNLFSSCFFNPSPSYQDDE